MTTKVGLAALILGSLLLTGCAGAPQGPPTAAFSPPTTPSANETSEPAKPALEDLVIEPEGLGPLRIGEAPPVTDPALDILVFDPDGCKFAPDGSAEVPESSDYGIWVSNYGVDPSTNLPGPFGVFVDGGVVNTIGIYDQTLTTAAGAHLGMTRDELLAAYPTALELETLNYGVDNYRLRGIAGDVVFSLWENTPGVFTVNQINVSYPGFAVPMGGSDYGAFGICYGP